MPDPKPTQPETPKLKRYRVSLPYVPETVVEATDRDDAIAKFNAKNGVISTIHPYKVTNAE